MLSRKGFEPVAAVLLLMAAGCSRGPTDDAIRREIEAKFAADPLVKGERLKVAVAAGEVTLSGLAGTLESEFQAANLARRTAGVRLVHDQIAIASAGALAKSSEPPEPPNPVLPRERAAEPLYQPAPPPTPDEVRYADWKPAESAAESATAEVKGPAVELPEPLPLPQPQPQPAPGEPPPAAPSDDSERHRSIVRLTAASTAISAKLYAKWFSAFHSEHPEVAIEAASKDAELGATDIALTKEQAEERRVLHFPSVIDGVAILCNFGEQGLQEIDLSGEVLASIYIGKIRKWDDEAIKTLNASRSLPSSEIVTVHRSDSSAVTAWLTDYLSTVSPAWKKSIGALPMVNWLAAGLGAKGDEGVAQLVKKTPFSIGYVEARFALENQLKTAAMRNMQGRFVRASSGSLMAAATGGRLLADLRFSIANSFDKNAYPIAGLTYLLVPERIPDQRKRAAAIEFLEWMLAHGAADARAMGFAALPRELVSIEQARISLIH